jgi:hypothetical protein
LPGVLAAAAATLLIATLTPSSGNGAASLLYVDAESRGGPCNDDIPAHDVTMQRPWCSLDQVGSTPSGGTVIVRGGNYPRLSVDGLQADDLVTIRAQRSERPVVAGVEVRDSRNLRIEGFRITDIARVDQSRRVDLVGNDISPHGVIAGESDELRFVRNRIHDLTIDQRPAGSSEPRCHSEGPTAGVAPRCGYGFRINYVTRVAIKDNLVEQIPTDGIQMAATADVLITGNRFEHISAFIDPVEHSDVIQMVGENARTVIRGNVFTQTRGLLAHPYPPPSDKFPGITRDLVIENNLFVQLRHWAVKLLDTSGARIVNNTFWYAGTGGVQMRDDSTHPGRTEGVRFYNNIVDILEPRPEAFALEDYNLIASGQRLGRHDISGRPRFRNPAALNYRLSRRSRAIDAGTRRGAPRVDLAGTRRPKGRGIDLGAYERSP